MPKRNHDYTLIAVLHDQLEDIENYDRYLKDAADRSLASRWREVVTCAVKSA